MGWNSLFGRGLHCCTVYLYNSLLLVLTYHTPHHGNGITCWVLVFPYIHTPLIFFQLDECNNGTAHHIHSIRNSLIEYSCDIHALTPGTMLRGAKVTVSVPFTLFMSCPISSDSCELFPGVSEGERWNNLSFQFST